MTCHNCGAAMGADDKFCPVCGMPTAGRKKPNFCMHCGTRLAPDDRFCPGCGWEIGQSKPAVNEPASNAFSSRLCHKPSQRGLNVKSVILVTLLLLSAAAFLAGTLFNWWRL